MAKIDACCSISKNFQKFTNLLNNSEPKAFISLKTSSKEYGDVC